MCNLDMTVFRIEPTGEFRSLLYATKVGKSPAKAGVDGIRAMAVGPRGRIHISSLLMLCERHDLVPRLVYSGDQATE